VAERCLLNFYCLCGLFLAICENFLFAVQLQLKVNAGCCVLVLGYEMGFVLVVAVVTSRMAKAT
jgi:hypothetical protein